MRVLNVWDFQKLKEQGRHSLTPNRPKLSISMSTCGLALGADDILRSITEIKKKENLRISVGETGCMGFCDLEPLGILRAPGRPTLVYSRMTVDRAKRLLSGLKKGKSSLDGILCQLRDGDSLGKEGKELKDVPEYHDLPFLKGQTRLILRHCGLIDPLSVAEYAAVGGYESLYKALYHMNPEEVCEEVTRSQLRGRGGAWFSTGFKWNMARKASGEEKFVICNADEGDPGAFKDRTVMEGNPFKLLEGMTLAGYGIGSHHGIIYLREEYPHTLVYLHKALEHARRYGFLGKNIMGSGFNFSIRIVRGGGAYVCGEETALMDSLEAEVGDPRLRPPFPIEKGLWDKPTIVNNVETLSNIPAIIGQGGERYTSLGTEKAKGTKIFSVVGRIRQPGLYEVPLGTSLRRLLFHMAGGPIEGKTIKAVQVGSPFGTFIPGGKLDLALDPETLRNMESMIGSGVIVVLDEDTCLVETLRHLLSFFIHESCGKCVPCREGVFRMYEIMTAIYEGRATYSDLYTLNELAEMITQFALCGLGGGAPVPVMKALSDFHEDFSAHMEAKNCPWKREKGSAGRTL